MTSAPKKKVKTSDALEAFRGVTNLAAYLETTKSAISQYGEYIPHLRAWQVCERFPELNCVASNDGGN